MDLDWSGVKAGEHALGTISLSLVLVLRVLRVSGSLDQFKS